MKFIIFQGGGGSASIQLGGVAVDIMVSDANPPHPQDGGDAPRDHQGHGRDEHHTHEPAPGVEGAVHHDGWRAADYYPFFPTLGASEDDGRI